MERSGRGTVDEAYLLSVGAAGCVIRAGGPRGALWALRTLEQLIYTDQSELAAADGNDRRIPPRANSLCLEVEDWPEWGWRGCMLDCARHWMPAEYVTRMVEVLSRFKMNVLHWHLADDQVNGLLSKVSNRK